MFTVVGESADSDVAAATGSTGSLSSLIDEIARRDARRMLAEASRAKVDAYSLSPPASDGYHPPRKVLTSAGRVG